MHERPLAPRHAAEAFVAARVRFLGGCARSGMPLRGRGARFEMLRSEAYLGRWFSPLTTQTAGSVSAVLQRKPEWLHASASAALAPLRPVPLSRNFGPHVRCAREPWERTAKRQICASRAALERSCRRSVSTTCAAVATKRWPSAQPAALTIFRTNCPTRSQATSKPRTSAPRRRSRRARVAMPRGYEPLCG